MKPIVSSIDSPTYTLAMFQTHMISPLSGRTKTVFKDPEDFVEKARSKRLEGCILGSFDITSLFTKVPTAEILEGHWRKVKEAGGKERKGG